MVDPKAKPKEPSAGSKAWNAIKQVADAASQSPTMHEIHAFLDAGSLELVNGLIKGEVAPYYGGSVSPAEKVDVGIEPEEADEATAHGPKNAKPSTETGVVDALMKEVNPGYDPQQAREVASSEPAQSEMGVVDLAMSEIEAGPEIEEPEKELSK